MYCRQTRLLPEHGGLGHDEGEAEGGERDEGAEGGQLPPAPVEAETDHQHRAHTSSVIIRYETRSTLPGAPPFFIQTL